MNANLTPCPRCSSRVALVRPQWTYARHTSEKREREARENKKIEPGTPPIRCYIWVGECSHGKAFFNNDRNPIGDEAELTAIEERWHTEALSLFSALTALWTPAQRALHAWTLGINLPPESPAQPKTDPNKS